MQIHTENHAWQRSFVTYMACEEERRDEDSYDEENEEDKNREDSNTASSCKCFLY